MKKPTFSEVLSELSWEEVVYRLFDKDDLNVKLSSDKRALTQFEVISHFMRRNHNVSESVLKAVLIKATVTARRTHGMRTVINEPYLRITLEQFKKIGHKKVISGAEQAANKLEKEFDDLRQRGIVKKVHRQENPAWVKTYLDELFEEERSELNLT